MEQRSFINFKTIYSHKSQMGEFLVVIAIERTFNTLKIHDSFIIYKFLTRIHSRWT